MKSTYAGPASALRFYEAVVAGAHLVRKGVTTASRNGHMFSFLDAGGTMALALPPDQRDEFVARYDSRVVEQHGRVMKDFVEVPAALLERTTELQRWFDMSYAWTGTRTPKATKRPATKRSRQ